MSGALKASVWLAGLLIAEDLTVATITAPVTLRPSEQNIARNAPEIAVSGFNLPMVSTGAHLLTN